MLHEPANCTGYPTGYRYLQIAGIVLVVGAGIYFLSSLLAIRKVGKLRGDQSHCTSNIISLKMATGLYLNDYKAPPFLKTGTGGDVLELTFKLIGPAKHVGGCPVLQKRWNVYDDWNKSGYSVRNWPLDKWNKLRGFSYRKRGRELHVPFIWCSEPVHDFVSSEELMIGKHRYGRNVIFIRCGQVFSSYREFVDEATFQEIREDVERGEVGDVHEIMN